MKVNTRKFTVLAILVAITVVLQLLATFLPIRIGGVELSFVLIPVVVAACYYGISGAAIVGFSFGLIVFIMGLTGATPFTTYLIFEVNWFYTVIGTVVRTTLAAIIVALVYKAVSKKLDGKVSYVVASACAPVANTLIFMLVFVTLFNPVLASYAEQAGYDNIIAYFFVGFVGINFVFELITTLVLAPAVCIALEKVIKK